MTSTHRCRRQERDTVKSSCLHRQSNVMACNHHCWSQGRIGCFGCHQKDNRQFLFHCEACKLSCALLVRRETCLPRFAVNCDGNSCLTQIGANAATRSRPGPAVRPALAGTFISRVFGTPGVIRPSPRRVGACFAPSIMQSAWRGGQLRRGHQLLDAGRARIFEGLVDPHPRHRAQSLPHPTR